MPFPTDPPGLRFTYPWDDLEHHVTRRGDGRLPVFVYGSLMNAASASQSLAVSERASCVPANAFGVVRVFDYAMSSGAFERYGPPPSPRHVAALSVHATGDPQDRVNGVVITLDERDIEGFRRREGGYHLVEIETVEWHDSDAETSYAFVLEGDNPATDVLPHPTYVEVCRAGAASVSEAFRDDFERTTYLADGQTLAEYLQASGG